MHARQVLSGLGWTSSATLLNVVAQMAFVAVLARQLEPAAFGLVAMGGVALRFASFFAQIGTTQTLIQRPELSPALATAALVASLAVSTLMYGLLALGASAFGWYFATPELPAVLMVLGLTLPLSAVSGPATALLRRGGRFAAVGMVDVASYVLGYGLTGVVCASAGLGVWSLVAAAVVQQALAAAFAFGVARYPLTWPVRRQHWRAVFVAGSRYSVIGLLEFLFANVESLSVGRWLGAAPMGLLSRSQLLANLPVEHAIGAANKVLFPALSAMQSDRARMADGFLVLLLASATISACVSAAVAAASADLVALLLGPRWGDSVGIVALVAAATPAVFVYSVCGITLDSLAALVPKMRLQALLLAVKVGLVAALWSGGLVGVVAAALIAEYARLAGGLWLVARALPLARSHVLEVAAFGVASAAAVGGAVALAAAGAAGWSLTARLLLEAAAALAAGSATLVAAIRWGHRFPPLARFPTLRRWHDRALTLMAR